MGFLRRRPTWEPPQPACAYAVMLSAAELPTLRELDARLEGDVERTLRVGDAAGVALPGVGAWSVEVLEAKAIVRLLASDEVAPAVVATAELADAVATKAGGTVADLVGQRSYSPGEWRVEDAIEPVDPREHVTLHAVVGERDEVWVHTHGLLKFGRPEVEVFAPAELADAIQWAVLDLAAYVIGGALIRPGETVGDPSAPVRVQPGSREPEHWAEVPVLELVGDDEALRALAAGYL